MLPSLFKDNRPHVTKWYRFPCGKVQSFKFLKDDPKTAAQYRAVVTNGGVEIQDPFRKGAPLGGYSNNRSIG